jgi:hypothetical protein
MASKTRTPTFRAVTSRGGGLNAPLTKPKSIRKSAGNQITIKSGPYAGQAARIREMLPGGGARVTVNMGEGVNTVRISKSELGSASTKQTRSQRGRG